MVDVVAVASADVVGRATEGIRITSKCDVPLMKSKMRIQVIN